MPTRGSKTAPRRRLVATEPPKEAPKKPKSFKNLRKINDFCLLAFSLPMAFRGLKMASRWPKRAPRGAQESPKTAPRALQERPKRGPGGDFGGSRGGGSNSRLGALLARSWSALGAVLGPSWAPLGAILGPLGAILRPWKAIESKKARRQASLISSGF